jgi:hypothetical protein
MRNGEMNPLLKGNFKWLSVSDEFGKFCSKPHTQNWRFTTDENRNRLWKLIHIIDMYLFHVHLISIWIMFVLIWKEGVWNSVRESELKISFYMGCVPDFRASPATYKLYVLQGLIQGCFKNRFVQRYHLARILNRSKIAGHMQGKGGPD